MAYRIVQHGPSRSFPDGDGFLAGASNEAPVVLHLGGAPAEQDEGAQAVLIELDLECLGVHTGEGLGDEGSNVLGFARYRNGEEEPTGLIELAVQPNSDEAAVEAAKTMFEEAGFEVALCADQVGRIVDRLVRPVYNQALRMLDEGLASAADLDATCRAGLGYPEGPLERVAKGDLARHYDISAALFEAHATPAYAPARRAVVAKQRATKAS